MAGRRLAILALATVLVTACSGTASLQNRARSGFAVLQARQMSMARS